MTIRNESVVFARQSQLSIALASMFLVGGFFAILTAILFPPVTAWTWPNPYVMMALTVGVAAGVFVRGRRLRRPTAAFLISAFVVVLITSVSMVGTFEQAIAAGLLVIGVTLVLAWFMSPLAARVLAYVSLVGYAAVLLIRFPGNGTVLLTFAIVALSVVLTEVFGGFKRVLQRRSLTDHLSQAWNRAGFERILGRRIRAAARTKAPLTLLYIDLDEFKSVNDTEGHLAGDRVLQEMSQSLQAKVRSTDTVARIGGDEFAVILPGTTAPQARALGDRLRREVTICAWSYGLAEYRKGEHTDEFIARSDAELREWKRRKGVARASAMDEGGHLD